MEHYGLMIKSSKFIVTSKTIVEFSDLSSTVNYIVGVKSDNKRNTYYSITLVNDLFHASISTIKL